MVTPHSSSLPLEYTHLKFSLSHISGIMPNYAKCNIKISDTKTQQENKKSEGLASFFNLGRIMQGTQEYPTTARLVHLYFVWHLFQKGRFRFILSKTQMDPTERHESLI